MDADTWMHTLDRVISRSHAGTAFSCSVTVVTCSNYMTSHTSENTLNITCTCMKDLWHRSTCQAYACTYETLVCCHVYHGLHEQTLPLSDKVDYLYHKGDMEGLKWDISEFQTCFLTSDPYSKYSNLQKFKRAVNNAIAIYVCKNYK